VLFGCGGLPPDGLATFKGSVGGVYSDGASVYLETNLEIIKVPAVGGAAVTLVPEIAQGTLYQAAVSGGSVDWVFLGPGNTNTVRSVSTEGGTPQTLTTLPIDGFPLATAADGDSVYLLGMLNVWRVSKSDGSRVALATFDQMRLAGQFSLAVDASNVYWATSGNTPYYTNQYVNDGVVMSVPLGGGPVSTIASTQAYPGGVAVDAHEVYWFAGNGIAGDVAGGTCTPSCVPAAIFASPIGSAAPTPIFSLDAPAMPELVVSDGFLYWISLLADGFSGNIVRVPVGGGTPEVVVDASDGVDSEVKFAVDATRIYWAGAMRPDDYLHWKFK